MTPELLVLTLFTYFSVKFESKLEIFKKIIEFICNPFFFFFFLRTQGYSNHSVIVCSFIHSVITSFNNPALLPKAAAVFNRFCSAIAPGHPSLQSSRVFPEHHSSDSLFRTERLRQFSAEKIPFCVGLDHHSHHLRGIHGLLNPDTRHGSVETVTASHREKNTSFRERYTFHLLLTLWSWKSVISLISIFL